MSISGSEESESDFESDSCHSDDQTLSEASNAEDPVVPQFIKNWWINEKLGRGFSGSIYRATNLHTQQTVALKLQPKHHACLTNQYERIFYPLMQGGKGIPRLWASGESGPWDFLAIDILGKSLDTIYRESGKDVMDLGSVCSIAMQVIERLEFMHGRKVLHRDIQLGNCVLGIPPNEKVIYMIDFGFSKRYIDPVTKRHIPYSKEKRDFIGNYWFSSVNVHCRGKVPSRRDDLEAVALMLIHVLTPRGLPWTRQGVPKTDEAHGALKRQKLNTTIDDLCKGLPKVFGEFLFYCRKKLDFDERPDYQQWIDRFRELAVDEGYGPSDDFMWPPRPPIKHKTINTPKRMLAPAMKLEDMGGILRGLAELDLGSRPVLVNHMNVNNTALRQAQTEIQKPSGAGKEKDVIDVSSDELPPRFALQKASQLQSLAKKAASATTNEELSKLVYEFIRVMQLNSGRTLTRPAFQFLDMLFKQLDDPSVYEAAKSITRSFIEPEPERDTQPSRVKLGVVARLRGEVGAARSNKELATMVADFVRITNRSAGRTISKDGFAFLKGLGERLTVVI